MDDNYVEREGGREIHCMSNKLGIFYGRNNQNNLKQKSRNGNASVLFRNKEVNK